MNDVIKSLLAHRSIRSYSDKPVDEAELDLIIKSFQAAPNWVNIQLVSVVAVKDPERRVKMAGLCDGQKHIQEAPVFLIFCADYYRVFLACQSKGRELEEVLEDLDTLIVGAHEVGIAVGTAVAAAESLGLGTVVIGDVRKNAQEMVKELNLPKYVIPVLGLCIGHPVGDPGLKPRLPKEAVYFEETYNHDLKKVLTSYDETYARYLKKRPWNNRVGNWSELVADFYSTSFHYQGVAEMLVQQKFPLAPVSKQT